jgi:hypothetical protein
MRFAILSVVAAIVLGGCGGGGAGSAEVTESEALDLLAEVIELGRGSDWDRLCQLAGNPYARAACLYDARSFLTYEQFPFPSARPAFLTSRDATDGARVLELCVTSAAGSFRNDFYVLRSEGALIAPYPVYWVPRTIADPGDSGVIRPPFAHVSDATRQEC